MKNSSWPENATGLSQLLFLCGTEQMLMDLVYIATAKAYGHDAIFVQPNPTAHEETIRLLEAIREMRGDKYFLTMHSDPMHAIRRKVFTEGGITLVQK